MEDNKTSEARNAEKLDDAELDQVAGGWHKAQETPSSLQNVPCPKCGSIMQLEDVQLYRRDPGRIDGIMRCHSCIDLYEVTARDTGGKVSHSIKLLQP